MYREKTPLNKAGAGCLKHPVLVNGFLWDRLDHVPMLDELSVLDLKMSTIAKPTPPGTRTPCACNMT